MKSNQRGFTLVELIIAVSIMVPVSLAAGAAIYQVMRNVDKNNDYVTAVNQVENAGFWIARDAQMAVGVSTGNLSTPYFLEFRWTEFNATGIPTYHSVDYFFENMVNSVGKLKRTHTIGTSEEETNVVGTYIYYEPSDNKTSMVNYQTRILTLKLTLVLEKATETKEYKINQRVNLNAQ